MKKKLPTDLTGKKNLVLKDILQYGSDSLVVFLDRPYQMFDKGHFFYLKEIPGFVSDDDVISATYFIPEDDSEERHRLDFSTRFYKTRTIAKDKIVGAEIGGAVKDYFTLVGGTLTLRVRKDIGSGTRQLTFYLPGEVNQFVARDFLGMDNISFTASPAANASQRKSIRGMDLTEPNLFNALTAYFERRGRRINRVNWLLMLLSLALIFAAACTDIPYGHLIRGIAALLPLLIYFIYLRYSGLIRLIVTDSLKQSMRKLRAECFPKIVIPSIALLLSELGEFGAYRSILAYEVWGIAIAVILGTLFEICVPKIGDHYRRQRIICVVMCLFYAFTAINAVNRAISFVTLDKVYNYPDSMGHAANVAGTTVYTCDMNVRDFSGIQKFPVSQEEYEGLKRYELSARVTQYRGLLGLQWLHCETVEASEAAKQHAAYLEAIDRITDPSFSRDAREEALSRLLPENREKYLDLLERLQGNVSPSDSDAE